MNSDTTDQRNSAKVALITGAGSGIGQACARVLHTLGFRLALLGRDQVKLDATAASLVGATSADGDRILTFSCDIAERPAVQSAVNAVIDRWEKIDLLICNAGINITQRAFAVLDPADWDALIATNLTGSFNLVHQVVPHMRARKDGLVIQISSISGLRAGPLGGIAYSAAKYGQSALGLCLGREERQNGIRSTVIYPGEVETPILDKRPVKVEADRRSVILQPEDIAAAVKFLAELHPRAHVTELVIKPTVDDFI